MEATLDQPISSTIIRTSRRVWAGRILSGIPVLFLLANAGMQLSQHPEAVKASEPLGIAAHTLPAVGLVSLVSALLFAVSRTAVLGAVLLTGLLGGAVFAHLRVDDPLFSHTLFPVYVGAMVWTGLYLRDARLKNLFSAA